MPTLPTPTSALASFSREEGEKSIQIDQQAGSISDGDGGRRALTCLDDSDGQSKLTIRKACSFCLQISHEFKVNLMAIVSPANGTFPWQSLSGRSQKDKKSSSKRTAAAKGKDSTPLPSPAPVQDGLPHNKSASLANAETFDEKIIHFYDQRCLKLWMIVLISLGQLPYSNHRSRLKKNKEFLKQYKKRLRFLKARTTTSPKDGLALCLPYHPMAVESDKQSEQYYDAVSALDVLHSKGYEMPSAAEMMISYLAQIPLPPGSYDVVPEDEKAKRDTSARLIAGMNEKMQILLVEMIRLHYKQPLTAQTMRGIQQLMVKDLALVANRIGKDGIQSQLELALGTYESRS